MARIKRSGFTLNYETMGPDAGKPLVLIAGLGEQIGSVEFPDAQCRRFVEQGFRVIRMDNRDCGLSVPDVELPARDVFAALAALGEGKVVEPDYTLMDMSDDAAAVLDDLGIAKAHVAGASLGGYIARWFALRHPARTSSATIIMSGSGAGPGDPGSRTPPQCSRGWLRSPPGAAARPRSRMASPNGNSCGGNDTPSMRAG